MATLRNAYQPGNVPTPLPQSDGGAAGG